MMALGAPALSWAQKEMQRQSNEFSMDPIAYFIQVARKVGIASLIAGVLLGVAGYYLKASATAAMNNETTTLGHLGAIFGNIKPLSFTPSPTGTAPLSFSTQGVQNFFNDAWKDVKGVAGDISQIGAVLGTLAEDVGMGLTDLAKVFLGFVMHFPDILWNALVWGIGGSVADILNWVFPWLLILGGALILASLVAQGARWLWTNTVGAAWREASSEWAGRLRERARTRFDRILRNPRTGGEKATASAPGAETSTKTPPPEREVSALAPSPPVIDAGPAAEPGKSEPEGGGGGETAPVLTSEGPATDSPETAPEGPVEVRVVELPPGQLTKEELEDALGKAFVEAKDAHRSGKVMPEPEPKHERTVREILTVA